VNLNVLYGAVYILSAIKWGDWKNWRAYYPTFLFLMMGDLVYQFILFNHSMWEYVPYGSDKGWAKHTHISFLVMLIKYPCTLVIFLGHLPKKNWVKILYIAGWSFIYTINEYLDLRFGALVHRHGWNLAWSAFFSFVMFLVLAVHYKRPFTAWIISALYAIFLWNVFDLHQSILK
jgi:hypothetical protein